MHLLAEPRAPTLSAISSDSPGAKEGAGRTSLLSVQGLISGLPAVILNDCGASHNFISRSWVERHELKTEPLRVPLGVKLADSSPPREVSHQTDPPEVLSINVATCSFLQSFAVIDLDGFDALLGKEWLSDCNPRIDFVTHEVQLQNGSFVADGRRDSYLDYRTNEKERRRYTSSQDDRRQKVCARAVKVTFVGWRKFLTWIRNNFQSFQLRWTVNGRNR